MTTQDIRCELDGAALADVLSARTGIRPVPATLTAMGAANSIRQLGLVLVTDPDERWAVSLQRMVAELNRERSDGPSRFRPSRSPAGDEYPMGSHPVLGAGNPVAPPIALAFDSDQGALVGRVTFGPVFEGVPGRVFGGHVAAGFDAVLGVAAALTGRAVVVRRMTVDYQEPTPLNVPLEYRVPVPTDGLRVGSAVVEVRGRLNTIAGTVTATGSAECVVRDRTEFCMSEREDQPVSSVPRGRS